MRICGQEFSPEILSQVRAAITQEPSISRRALSLRVCEWLGWRSANGHFQEGGCRKALAELNRRGLIKLPTLAAQIAARRAPPALTDADVPKINAAMDALGEIKLVLVERTRSDDALTWRSLVHHFHYLGDKPLCGAQLRYLVHSEYYGWVGALAFNSAAWALKARDNYIGWSEAARRTHLARVVCNSRFLILPSVQVPNLASHVLSLAAQRLGKDWVARYGCEPVLLETFIDPTHYEGTCYRAANWIEVGETSGRRDGVAKQIWLYPMVSDWQRILCQQPTTRLGEWARPSTFNHWTEKEFGSVRLYDRRLKQRLMTIAEDFYQQPLESIPQACDGSLARSTATYRLLANSKITMDVILTAHLESTIERIKEHSIVLAPQDTSTLNYHHRAVDGLGPTNTNTDKSQGMLLHDTVAFSEQGTPLGVIDAQCWARDPEDRNKTDKRRKVSFEEKESSKWLHSFRKLAEVQKQCPDTTLVSIGDRESDIYELLHEAVEDPDGPKLLIRAARSRKRKINDEPLWDTVGQQPLAGQLTLSLPKRGNRQARDAHLDVRFMPVEMQPPKGKSKLGTVKVWVVHLLETNPDDGGEPIEWMLYTTVEVTTFEQAVRCSQWYAARWGIEVYHRTLKSGCRIKDRQLGTADQLQRCLAIDMVVAWRLYHMTMIGRETPDHPCTVFFDEVEWKALYCCHYETPVTPEQPPTMSEATRMLAKLGGHLGRKGDGLPGTQVLWRGLQKLDTAIQMYQVFTNAPPPTSWKSYPDGYLPPTKAP